MKKQIVNKSNGNMIVNSGYKEPGSFYYSNDNVLSDEMRNLLIANYYGYVPAITYKFKTSQIENALKGKRYVFFEVTNIEKNDKYKIELVEHNTSHDKNTNKLNIDPLNIVCFALTHADFFKDDRPDDYPNGMYNKGKFKYFGILLGKETNDILKNDYCLIINGLNDDDTLNDGGNTGAGTPPGIGAKIPQT